MLQPTLVLWLTVHFSLTMVHTSSHGHLQQDNAQYQNKNNGSVFMKHNDELM